MTRVTAWVNRRPKLKQEVVALIEVAETISIATTKRR